MKPQSVLIVAALVITGRFARLQCFTLAFAITLLITTAVFIFTPAAGAFAYLGLGPADAGSYTPSMTYRQLVQLEGVRNGTLTTIRFDDLEGLIAFPSFHTGAGILATWGLWPIRRLRWWVAALNAAMIASTPCDGAHYFIDLAGGAAAAALAIWGAIRIQSFAGQRAGRSQSATPRLHRIGPGPGGSGLKDAERVARQGSPSSSAMYVTPGSGLS